MTASITPAMLTSFDWFLVGVVVVSVLMAFRRGIIRVLFSIGGLVAGIVLASWNYPRVAAWLHVWVTSIRAAEVMAFLGIMMGVMVVVSVAGAVLRKTAAAVGLGMVDRLLGAVFGGVRGVLLGVAGMMALAAFLPNSPWIRDSRLAPYFLDGAHAVSFVVPKRLRRQVSDGAAYLLQQTPELIDPYKPAHPM